MVSQNTHSGAQAGRPTPLDLIDRKILAALRRNGRLTMNELASEVGLSASPCWTRVRRLEAAGVITGYAALIDQRAIGIANIIFVEVTLDRHDDRMLERFGEALARIPEVLDAYLVTGDYDYLVRVAVTSTEHYERFLRDSLYRIEGIRHSRSTFALRTLKQASSVDPMLID
jgi:Lrp/AsnC family leucine-responsive transcriptional regulator